jgi:2-dehydro-3-deoxyphosphogluconate aldolase/(4S)-4-hydroxy-2-oxoglutarate aldolase
VTSTQSASSAAEITAALKRFKLVPVIVIDDPAAAGPLGEALARGGLPCAEVTFRTAGAREALSQMAKECPDVLLGAGTVLTPDQVRAARDSGARFIVAPGFNPVVVDYCLEQDIPVFPGVATPSEIEQALMRGLKVVKFFPAEPLGGIPYLKAMSAPYGGLEFMPTGGVTLQNVGSYLAFPKVIACGGSWMAPNDWIAAGEFDRIASEVARAVETVQSGDKRK